MRTAIKILGLVGAVSGIVALKRRSDAKKDTDQGVKKDVKKSAVAIKNSLNDEHHEFLGDAEKFVNQSVRKIKSFSKNVGAKAKDLDEKTMNSFNAKIAKISDAKDEIRTKIHEFKNSAEDKKDALKKKIELRKIALSKSIDSFEKAWK